MLERYKCVAYTQIVRCDFKYVTTYSRASHKFRRNNVDNNDDKTTFVWPSKCHIWRRNYYRLCVTHMRKLGRGRVECT